jgi:hypothetical protein
MIYGLRAYRWYHLVLVLFAAVIVYPDMILDWIGTRIGKICHWGHLILLEIIAITALAVCMTALMRVYPRLDWWAPLLPIGVLGLLRLGMWMVSEFFGFDE